MSKKVQRKAGRPKKEIQEEVQEKEAQEAQEETSELEELKRQIVELKKIAESTQANQVEQQRKPKREVKPKVYEEEHICCEIETTHGNLEAARQAKFYELADGNGGVELSCPRSGLSVYYKNLIEFPAHNVRVPCDPRFNSFWVRYKIVREK